MVIGIGGGSALDAAKAIAGLLKPGNSVMDHLEGVGPELPYVGPATPFIAVPTTAGTGSEATKNAVLSLQGADGFKKSFRDNKLVAEYALIDPDLLATCPPAVIAANGMDAFTQLLESYVSSRAAPFTDSLAWGGMKAARDGLLALLCRHRQSNCARTHGLRRAGVRHHAGAGWAWFGARTRCAAGRVFPIPHGVACGTLVATATRINIESPCALARTRSSRAGKIRTGRAPAEQARATGSGCRAHRLGHTRSKPGRTRSSCPRLAHFGVTLADIPRIVANSRGSSMKTNPLQLEDSEIAAILEARL